MKNSKFEQFCPDFFVAGFPKCGTTTVYDVLHKHPSVDMSAVKEPHFFSPDIEWYQNRRISADEDYRAIFGVDDLKVRGESSTWYLHSKCAVSNIEKINSKAKYIVCVRKPSDAVKSLIDHRIYSGKEGDLSLSDVLNNKEKRDIYFSYYRYEVVIKRFLEKIDRDRVMFVQFERLVNGDAEVFDSICDFLEVPCPKKIEIDKLNPSKSKRPLVIQRIVSLVPLWVKARTLTLVGEHGRAFFWRGVGKFGLVFNLRNSRNSRSKISEEALSDFDELDFVASDYLAELGVEHVWK